jgi:glycerol uptake facilitator-like aquaporin
MLNKRAGSFLKWVYIAYSFYFLLGLSWFLVSLIKGGHFNPTAFFITVIFGAQFYYKHLIANLVLGVLSLFFSIFMLLQALNMVIPAASHRQLEVFDKVIVSIPIVSLVMSGVLVFSYIKLNFKD